MERKAGENISDAEIAKAESEVIKGYRKLTLKKFKDKENVVVFIYHPTLDEQTIIADYYTDKYNSYLFGTSTMPTKKQMVEQLKKKGIWTDKDDDSIENARKSMIQCEIEIFGAQRVKNDSLVSELQSKYRDLRNKLIELVTLRESYLSQTIEGKTEDAANMMKIVLCVKYEDGSRIWNDIKDLAKERSADVFEIISEATYFWNGLSREVLQSLPGELITQGGISEQLQEPLNGNEDIPLQQS